MVLQMRDVTRVFGSGAAEVHALVGASLDVDAGDVVAITGPSGSGKTTLLTIAGGLDSPTSGDVVVDGSNLVEADPAELAKIRRRTIGYVFQELNLLASLTAAENAAVPLELDGISTTKARSQAVELLESVGLGHKVDVFPDNLSGGERQRVAIARAIIGDRRLVLADEPTGALDSETGASVMDLLRSLSEDGRAVIVVTHDPEVSAMTDRVVSIRDGRLDSAGARR